MQKICLYLETYFPIEIVHRQNLEAWDMVHFVKIQAGITDPSNLYKKTEKKDGVKTTFFVCPG